VSWSKVFVPEGETQGRLDFIALNTSFQLLYLGTDVECSAAALAYVCGTTFQGCESLWFEPLDRYRTLDVSLPSHTFTTRETQRERETERERARVVFGDEALVAIVFLLVDEDGNDWTD